MEPARDITENMISGFGLISIVVIVFTLIVRRSGQARPNALGLGLLFGVGAVVGMLHPTEVQPGIIVDPRAVMLALAAPFGGPVAAAIAVVMASAMRAFIGGAGTVPGIVGIILLGLIGYAHYRIFPRRKDVFSFSVLGIAAAAYLISLAILPRDIALLILIGSGPYLVILNFIGIVLMGLVLSLELKYRNNLILLQAAAEEDPLTRLANRRVLERFGGKIQRRAEENQHDFSVIMFDIDHFKSVNDRFGHQVGDMVLEEVSQIIALNVRKSDLVVRYGGEEIAAVLPSSTKESARSIAENIREKVQDAIFIHGDARIKVTVSAGLSTSNRANTDFEMILKEADRAVYYAKRHGRNRVETFGEDEEAVDELRSA